MPFLSCHFFAATSTGVASPEPFRTSSASTTDEQDGIDLDFLDDDLDD